MLHFFGIAPADFLFARAPDRTRRGSRRGQAGTGAGHRTAPRLALNNPQTLPRATPTGIAPFLLEEHHLLLQFSDHGATATVNRLSVGLQSVRVDRRVGDDRDIVRILLVIPAGKLKGHIDVVVDLPGILLLVL